MGRLGRGRKLGFAVLLGFALVATAATFVVVNRLSSSAEAAALDGLAWLPAESGLVASVDLAGLREQTWLTELAERVSGEVTEAPDYRAFVEVTGFDYTRDLDRVWLGVTGQGKEPHLVAVAEGRFDRARILSYAQQQGAVRTEHEGVEMYTFVAPARLSTPAAKPLSLAFLDDTHLALASTPERAAQIIDCWQGRGMAIAGDSIRRAELERLATGRQVWAVDDTAKFAPRGLPTTGSGQPISNLIEQLTFGLRASAEGLELNGEARCHEPAQAERLRDNVFILVEVGRLAMQRQPDETSQALARILDRVAIDQQGASVQARVLLPPQELEQLLPPPPAPPAAGAPSR